MRKIVVYLTVLFFFNQSLLFSYSSNPKDFVFELVSEAINKLADKSLTKENKEKFIADVAIENVDISALGLYTLGELRKSASKKEIAEYQITFEKY